jgi:predicted transcriptional regulator of viral defense system
MSKFEQLDNIVEQHGGYLKTADAQSCGISRVYLGDYVKQRGMERVAHGLYLSADGWPDPFYILQYSHPKAVFSHETALYVLGMAEREPVKLSVTIRTADSASPLAKRGVKVYKTKEELYGLGITNFKTPMGNQVTGYNRERTLCDLIRSRNTVEIQSIQTAVREYVKAKDRNIPELMRYADVFKVDKTIRQYMEVLL